jgi:hypothetical protein
LGANPGAGFILMEGRYLGECKAKNNVCFFFAMVVLCLGKAGRKKGCEGSYRVVRLQLRNFPDFDQVVLKFLLSSTEV